MLTNKKDDNRMLLIEGICVASFVLIAFLVNHFHPPCNVDNGGGMDPDKMRLCMSLGFSLKSKIKDAIGQCK